VSAVSLSFLGSSICNLTVILFSQREELGIDRRYSRFFSAAPYGLLMAQLGVLITVSTRSVRLLRYFLLVLTRDALQDLVTQSCGTGKYSLLSRETTRRVAHSCILRSFQMQFLDAGSKTNKVCLC
jgi:hypothetical protein